MISLYTNQTQCQASIINNKLTQRIQLSKCGEIVKKHYLCAKVGQLIFT